MAPNLGDDFLDFKAESTHGTINWHAYIEGSWAILFSHPNDFMPVCTTELGSVESLKDEFQRRGVKVAALSCNDVESHEAWVKDIVAVNQCKGPGLHFPIIADPERTIAHALGMLDEKARDAADMPITCRAVYIVGPDKKLKLSLLYPASTGRNFGEERSASSTRSLQPTSRTPPPPSPSPCPSPSHSL